MRVPLRLLVALAVGVAGTIVGAAPGGDPARAAVTEVELTYEIGTAGTVSTDPGGFADHVASTLDDPDGWSLGGSIEFTPVSDGGDLRILLAQPAVIGDIAGCSARYSCHVSGDVYINENRWNRGAAGWSFNLERYRHYVVNHEVGHYLALDHVDCPGAGEPAPVMMQQTIETEPCRNRVWPLGYERQRVAQRYGVSVLSPSAASLGYVRAAHFRTLARTPSEVVANDTAISLDRGSLDRTALLGFLFASNEFDAVPGAVARLYFAGFDRPPEPGGLVYWAGQVQSGLSVAAVAEHFAGSDEFTARYGELDAQGYVAQLYRNVLGRAPDAEGGEYWASELRSGARTRGGVLDRFTQSAEHRARRRAEVTVAVAYNAIIDRRAEEGGLTYWSDRLEGSTSPVTVLGALRDSPEAVL